MRSLPDEKSGVITLRGLLYLNGEELDCCGADKLANKYGYVYAEELVKAMEKQKSVCGICGGTSIRDLGHGRGDATIICDNRDCRAKFWRKWYTAAEWTKWVECVSD